jgi:ABC-2 type transport system permease protein
MTKVPEEFQKIVLLNPMAQIIQDARNVFVWPDTMTLWGRVHSLWAFVPIVFIVVMVFIASVYFKKQSRTFAEDI